MKMGVYILLCKNQRFYAGSTNDLDRRLKTHFAGQVKATCNLLPLHCVAFIPCITLTEARQLERKIKKMKSKKHIQDLVEQFPLNR